MKQAEETQDKITIPPGCSTHKHTSLSLSSSLPNSQGTAPGLGSGLESSFPQGDSFSDSHYGTETVDSGSLSSDESAAEETFEYSEEEFPETTSWAPKMEQISAVVRHRLPLHEDIASSPSHTPFNPSQKLEYDSEEDCDTVQGKERWPRIGPNFQADLDRLSSDDLAEDSAELLWDPEAMSEDDLDTLMMQCNVSASTFRSHQLHLAKQSSVEASHAPSDLSLVSSIDSTSTTSGMTSSNASQTPQDTATFLPLEQMLQLVHDSHYNPSEVIENLKKRNIFGWSSYQSMFKVWEPTEIDLFESAMVCYPKQFNQIAAIVGTRTVGECIEFYYSWKHSPRHAAWTRRQLPEIEEEPAMLSRKVPSRKRKREVELPMDASERLYLEALGSYEHPQHMLNIILDAPSIFAEDLPHHEEETHEIQSSEVIMEEKLNAVASDSGATVTTRALAAASPKRPKLAEPDDVALLHDIDMESHTHVHQSSAPTTIDPTNIFSPLFSPPETSSVDFFMHF